MGLLCAKVAKCRGAKRVVVVDVNKGRLAFAKEYVEGCGTYLPSKENSPEDIAQELVVQNNLHARGATIVLEATGHPTCIHTGIHVLQPGGHFVQAGLGPANIEFPIVALSEKEIHLHGSFRYGAGDFETARELMESGKIEAGGLVSSVLGFEKASAAWERTRRGEGITNVIEGPRD